MAGGYDLIGPKVSPRGKILGLDVRAGDSHFPMVGSIPFGPVVQAVDPLTSATRFFRLGIQIQDNGDSTTSPVIVAVELDTEGNIIG